MRYSVVYFLLVVGISKGIGTSTVNNRSHPELKWSTIKTIHFDVHFHQGIRDIALRGASIAEQVRPILMRQMDLDSLPRLDIVFTSEDEILNGFAMSSNNTIIWIDQNDAALWNGDEKWLRTVLAHELQHLVYFNLVRGPWWLPRPMNILTSGVPAWYVEGMAEYFTEKWRPFRYDISHKGHVITNNVHKIKDPHNDGFSKSLYFAERFGDSTFSKIIKHRNKFGVLFFEKAFRKHTGIKLKQFNEDWRRHMNTFYFGERSQKEVIEDIGEISKLPMNRIKTFNYFSDTTQIALIGQLSKGQGDNSLVLASRDTEKEKKIFKKRLKNAKDNNKKAKKVKPIWKLKELDYGKFGEMVHNLDVAPNGNSIIYPKYGYGQNQSLLFDIWHYDLRSKNKKKLTNSLRANYPKFSPDGKTILFVAHKNSNSQLYIMNSDGTNIRQLTNYKGEVQIITPAWSPDGKFVAFAKSDDDGFMDLHIYNLKEKSEKQLTNSPDAEYLPVWNPNGKEISFTGLKDYTPNLYTIDLKSNNIIQNTNVSDGVTGIQWNLKRNAISGMTLQTVDTSRIVYVSPKRIAKISKINMNSKFSSWRKKTPIHPILDINYKKKVNVLNEESYRFYKNLVHSGTIIIPDDESVFVNTVFSDGLGRHNLGGAYISNFENINSYALQYRNSVGFPFGGFWGIDYYKDINFQFQFYTNTELLIELFNGFSLWGSYPYNSGKSLSNNHSLDYSLQLLDRVVIDSPISDVFGPSQSGKESSINLKYTLVNKRNHKKNLFLPDQGFGFEIKSKVVPNFAGNDFNYMKFEMDHFLNKKLGPLVFYLRNRFEILEGESFPNQEKLGIFDIQNYYIAGAFLPGREYMSLRGFSPKSNQYQIGDKALLNTLELRAPVIPLNVIEILKFIKLGQPTIALISDIGTAWDSKLTYNSFIKTSGVEFRFALTFSNMPLFIFSYGLAQENKKWAESLKFNDQTQLPEPYFQWTLINPF